MKYLSDYTKERTSALLENTGAFFAFSNKQFEEQRKEGVTYGSLGAGLTCPVDRAAELREGLDAIGREGRAQDLAENGMDAVIERELANHECYYTGDPGNAMDALSGYEGATEERVNRVFRDTYEKNSQS